MTLLSNCQLTKLREYSRSYGSPETIAVPFIQIYDSYIYLLNERGVATRKMNKGTKVLINYTGEQITERAFKMRTKKAIAKAESERQAREAEAKIQADKCAALVVIQGDKWRNLLANNPDKVIKYKAGVNTRPSNSSRSGNWRNWLRMKYAKHCNEGKFEGMVISAPELCDILNSIN